MRIINLYFCFYWFLNEDYGSVTTMYEVSCKSCKIQSGRCGDQVIWITS